ncbi:MAG: Hsp20 family protein, partial [Hyphomicrobiales bacterium]
SSPYLLGFEDIERMLDNAAKTAGDGYPPYNIERIVESDGSENLRIVLAVAGFSADDLEITVEDNQVTIHGKQSDDNSRTYLHRGIAARQFHRSFVLAEGMEVTGATLENGLLAVELLRRAPEKIVRTVEITTTSEPTGGAKS